MRLRSTIICLLLLGAALLAGSDLRAQRGILGTVQNGIPQSSGPVSDSIRHRNKNEDSITISYRYLDTAGRFRIDSSLVDFYRRFPLPFTQQYTGNLGAPAQPLLFTPKPATGFDPGLHAFDAYKWTVDRARFYTTTRPYTE